MSLATSINLGPSICAASAWNDGKQLWGGFLTCLFLAQDWQVGMLPDE